MTHNHAKFLLSQGYGMIAMGAGLGMFLGPPENDVFCPGGWLFIDITPEKLVEFVDEYKRGRSAWPARENKVALR